MIKESTRDGRGNAQERTRVDARYTGVKNFAFENFSSLRTFFITNYQFNFLKCFSRYVA